MPLLFGLAPWSSIPLSAELFLLRSNEFLVWRFTSIKFPSPVSKHIPVPSLASSPMEIADTEKSVQVLILDRLEASLKVLNKESPVWTRCKDPSKSKLLQVSWSGSLSLSRESVSPILDVSCKFTSFHLSHILTVSSSLPSFWHDSETTLFTSQLDTLLESLLSLDASVTSWRVLGK